MKNLVASLFVIFCTTSFLFAQNQTAQKYINIELFTNTWCGLCAFYDPPAIATYMVNKKDIHLVTYYPDVPYHARKNYYGVNATPRTFTLGTQQNTDVNLITQSNINANLGQTSPLRVEVIESGPSTNRTVNINIKSFDSPPAGDLRLFVATIVEHVDFTAENGLTEHDNVLWQFLSSEDGDVFSPANLCQTNTDNLTHPSYMANQVYTIAFVQDYTTKEVINSGSSKDIIIDALVTNDSGSGDGAIDITLNGGDGNYNVLWSTGATMQDLNNLTAGNYTIVATDGAGAEVESIVTVGSGAAASISGLPPFTSSSSPITLVGNPAGGTFSGPGVVFSAFNPALAGTGTHTITYTDPCGNSVSQNILVFTITFNFVNYNLGTIAP